MSGGAAECAGLRKGDVLVRLGERTVASSKEAFAAVREQAGGAAVNVSIVRDGEEHRVSLTLDSADSD